MSQLVNKFKKYLDSALGLYATIEIWEKKDVFPLFLHGLYDFYRAQIFNKEYLIAVAKSKERPSVICKHIWLAQEKAGMPCIYVSSSINFANHKKLIAHRILFVIPGKQIYLPEIGIAWVENCRSYQLSHKLQGSHKLLSPVAQAIAIYALMHSSQNNFASKYLAQTLSYTRMSISRALDELEGHELGHTIRKNKERFFYFTLTSRDFWEALYPFLKNPVKKRVWIQCKALLPGVLAGMSALAKLTDLAEPELPIYAIEYKKWQALSFNLCEDPDDADIELELWHYDPALLASSRHVDPFSLYLSLKELQDERVEKALETMIAGVLC